MLVARGAADPGRQDPARAPTSRTLLGDPLRDFFKRYRGTATLILALICVYRLSDFVLNIMNPFYLDLGFSLTEIAEVRKLFGVRGDAGRRARRAAWRSRASA